jgi:protein O-mannosyl-transferase
MSRAMLSLNNKRSHLAILIILACAAYFNSLQNTFVSDDLCGILNNAEINKLSSLRSQPLFFLRPLLYFIVANAWGEAAVFFRLINISFHIGAVLAAYFLIRRLCTPAAAFFAAGIFAVHPIGIEAVGWISGGPYVQYGFFLLLALLLYSFHTKNKKIYLASLSSFFLALVSSEKAAVFPLILITFIICFGNLKKEWKKSLPFFGISFIWVIACLLQIKSRISTQTLVYSQKPELLNPLVQIPVAITSYLQLIFWPKDLTLYHSELNFAWNEYLLRLVLTVIFLAATVYAFKRHRRMAFWPAFFMISLLPTLTPLGVSWVVAERYVYLGSLGIFVIVALCLEKFRKIKRAERIVYFIYFAIIAALITRTVLRNIDWKNEDNLWIATAKLSPSSPNTHNNMGDVYGRRGDLASALKEFSRAIALNPNFAEAYHNLASTYRVMGKLKEAEEAYKRAITLRPAIWQSYQDLTTIYFQTGDYAAAKASAIQAIKFNPQNPRLHFNLFTVFLKLGEREQAKEELRRTLWLDPGDQTAKKALRELK